MPFQCPAPLSHVTHACFWSLLQLKVYDAHGLTCRRPLCHAYQYRYHPLLCGQMSLYMSALLCADDETYVCARLHALHHAMPHDPIGTLNRAGILDSCDLVPVSVAAIFRCC